MAGMSTAISVSGLRKTFGGPSPSTVSISRSPPARCTGSSAPTAPGSPPRCGSLLGLLRATGRPYGCSAGDPWHDAADPPSTAGLRPRRGASGRTSPVARWIVLLGRRRGEPDPGAARTCSSCSSSTRPSGSVSYSKGNRQKVALIAALAAGVELLRARRADVGPRPADGADVPDYVRERRDRRSHGAAVQPHPGRGRGARATGSASSARAGPSVRDPRRAAAPDPPTVISETRMHAGGRTAYRAAHVRPRSTAVSRFDVDTRTSTPLCPSSPPATSGPWSATLALEELFLRHYGESV